MDHIVTVQGSESGSGETLLITCSCGTELAEWTTYGEDGHGAVATLVELNELAHEHVESAERART